jgi:hypothetical protein
MFNDNRPSQTKNTVNIKIVTAKKIKKISV